MSLARSGLPTLLALLFSATCAFAQTPRTVFLEELTWTELQAQIRAGKTTIIVPIGGTEQNGPHMALGKHNVRVKALSERIALALGDAIVAPVIAYVPEGSVNPPTGHMRFPGTITMPADAYQTMLEYASRSFRLHGFRDIVFLGDHGSYQSDNRLVARKLNREWSATPARVHAIDAYYDITQTSFLKTLKAKGFRDEEIGSHAGLADVSMMLAVDPQQVRQAALRAGTKSASDDGVSGDARRASPELGQIGVDAVVAGTVDAIRKSTRR